MTGTDWTDLFGDITIAQGLVWLAAAGVLITLIVKIWKPLKAFADFLDDVKGEPARPGVQARPGLMERVSGIEKSLSEVRHEVMPNTGTSLRDVGDRTEKKVDALTADMVSVHEKLDTDNRRLNSLTEVVTRNHPEEEPPS